MKFLSSSISIYKFKNNSRHLVLFASILFLNSCFKKEKPVKLPSANSIVTTLNIGKEYKKEFYFDLSTATYKENNLHDWDIKFEANKDGFGVFVNNGNNITVRKMDRYNLTEVAVADTFMIKSMEGKFDYHDRKIEKSAFGDWRPYKRTFNGNTLHGIYVLELSYISDYNRFLKIQIVESNDTAYILRVNKLYESNLNDIVVKKDPSANYTYVSFRNGFKELENVEPHKETWDIEFTRYIHTFTDLGPAPLPYPVNGVLINKYKVEVAKDSFTNFYDIDYNSIKNLTFKRDVDAIGFDWKTYDIYGASGYSVNRKLVYIIKTTEGYLYKLRFLDFYNKNRETGYPKFEFQRIL